MARYRKPAMPHPSVTGMGAGLSIANYLNTGVSVGKTGVGGVIADAAKGNINMAFTTFSKNAVDLVTSKTGKSVLSSAIVLATAGGIARKWFPNVRLGGTKFYFKI